MDVDAPSLLKRCNSAPLINEATSTTATSPSTNVAPRNTSCFSMLSNTSLHRTRRFSASFSPLVTSPVSAQMPRLTPRVNQLRQEECADVSNTREVAHEREVCSAMQMGQSCEDLTLMTVGLGVSAPISPSRLHRFSPSVSPSPTRKYMTRRSLSPIALRASCLSPGPHRPSILVPSKRRFDDGDSPCTKRVCPSDRLTPLTPSTPGTPDSDSLIECTFRPVSPRNQLIQDRHDPNHNENKQSEPS